MEGGRVASIRGNRDDTWSRGHICPKGATLGALHEDPDRIRRPMIKVDGQWQEVSWDAAFRRCTELLAPVIDEARHRRGDLLHRQPARALVLPRPLHRCAARHVGHPDELLAGHRRPVAEEPVVAPDVRRLVELPGARHRAHRPAGRHGRQPGRIAGIAARRARRDGHHRRNPQAGQGHCRSTPCAPPPPPAPTSGCRSHPAPMRRCCSRSRTRCSPRTSSTSAIIAPHLDGRGPDAGRWPPSGHRSASPRSPASTPSASARWRVSWRAPNAPSCTAESACATRSSAAWPAGSSTSSTSSSGHFDVAGGVDVPAGRGVVGHRAADPRARGRCAGVRPVPHPRPRCEGSARAGAGVVPGRGDRDAGRGPDQGADHGRGQPRAVDARRATSSTRRCRRWTR